MDKLITIIRLLRPRFYNRITSFVITIGASLLTKPFWLVLLNYILSNLNKNHSDIDLDITNGFDWLIGLILIFGALIWNTINRLLDLQYYPKQKEAFKRVKIQEHSNFISASSDLHLLLSDNEKIFKSVGPNSSLRATEELRVDLTLWYKYREEVIVPNNKTIKDIINISKYNFNQKERNISEKMILHIDAFELHVQDPEYDYSEYQFPVEFKGLVERTCFERTKKSKRFIKQLKWIKKKLNIIDVKEWYVFGSTVFTPDYSFDMDIVILTKNLDILNKIDSVKTEFKLKFKKSLHETVFEESEIQGYKEFISLNKYKIK